MNQAGDHRYPTFTLDIERCQAMLDAPDLSDAQKAELNETLWNVVVGFIGLNIGIHAADSCGKPADPKQSAACDAPSVVKSSIPLMKSGFTDAARNPANGQAPTTNKQEAS